MISNKDIDPHWIPWMDLGKILKSSRFYGNKVHKISQIFTFADEQMVLFVYLYVRRPCFYRHLNFQLPSMYFNKTINPCISLSDYNMYACSFPFCWNTYIFRILFDLFWRRLIWKSPGFIETHTHTYTLLLKGRSNRCKFLSGS